MSDQGEADLFRRLTAQIVAAHVSHNKLESAEVPPLIEMVYRTLADLGKTAEEPVRPEPAVPVRKSVFPDYVICLEAEDAQAASEDGVQHDSRPVSDEMGIDS
jgi:predicted transcriptional regulator